MDYSTLSVKREGSTDLKELAFRPVLEIEFENSLVCILLVNHECGGWELNFRFKSVEKQRLQGTLSFKSKATEISGIRT